MVDARIPPVTRLAIVDDHPVVRDGLSRLVLHQDDLELAGELTTGDGAAETIIRLEPDVVVLDIGLPAVDGISVARSLRERAPGIRILFLSMHDDDSTLRAVLPLQPDGYLLKTEPVARVLSAVRSSVAGRPDFSEGVRQRMRELARTTSGSVEGARPRSDRLAAALVDLEEHAGPGSVVSPGLREELEGLAEETRRLRSCLSEPFEQLTSREKYVLARLVDGHHADAIAEEAVVSITTVRSQIRSILTKLEVTSQLEAVALARRAGWPHDSCDVLVLGSARRRRPSLPGSRFHQP